MRSLDPVIAHLVSLTALEWVNGVLALLAAGVAFGSINLMNKETVERGVACAFVTFAAGCLGYALPGLFPLDWGASFDTLLLGGALALLLANRRVSLGKIVGKLSISVTVGSWMVFFVAVS